MDEPTRVTLRVSDDDVDDQELDELTRRLRDELLDLDVMVDGARAGEAPADAKSVELAGHASAPPRRLIPVRCPPGRAR
jgi:hypothetical protein